MASAETVILQPQLKPEDGNHALGMTEQTKRRNLSSWQCCGAVYHGLLISDFFYIRKGKLSCKSPDLRGCLLKVDEPNLEIVLIFRFLLHTRNFINCFIHLILH